GNSYQLLITTADGTQYASDVQLMQAAGEIRDLYYEFVPQHSYNSRTGLYEDAFYVYLDAQADAQSNGLLRWRYEGIYENLTNPELHFFVIGTPAGPIRVPDPLPCSGYSAQVDSTTNPAAILQTPNGPMYRVGDCSCWECWVYENNGRLNLARNQFVSDKTFSKVLIAIVPVDRWRFQKRYAIDVTQLSITESVYDFWKLVESQQQGANSLFQPNIVIINGNIKNLSNPDDQVLGVFSASARTSKQLFIERSAVPYNLNAPPVFWNDCRTQFSRSTTEKPLFW
ncbi:MAG TPA: DUF4249 family protein, partial [Cyclobacteriaceae bacterium]|nr:DUF4249 family protein [Cyclobacteriaceae bacterium]